MSVFGLSIFINKLSKTLQIIWNSFHIHGLKTSVISLWSWENKRFQIRPIHGKNKILVIIIVPLNTLSLCVIFISVYEQNIL